MPHRGGQLRWRELGLRRSAARVARRAADLGPGWCAARAPGGRWRGARAPGSSAGRAARRFPTLALAPPARAAMGLLRLLALAALASQPGVAGGAETIGNSSAGKAGAPPSAAQVAFAFLARSKPTSPAAA